MKLLCDVHTQSGPFIKLVNWTVDLRMGKSSDLALGGGYLSFIQQTPARTFLPPRRRWTCREWCIDHWRDGVRGMALPGKVWKEEADPPTKAKIALQETSHFSPRYHVNLFFRDVLRDVKSFTCFATYCSGYF